jgi:catechol 2,3-dioxygenase-like lactoylglutathione lyase family enzyme
MYAHIQLGVRDLEAMTVFYDRVLAELGLCRVVALDAMGPAGLIWRRTGERWPQFVINTPLDGQPADAANGSQVSFLASSRCAVEGAWQVALSMGATSLGAPGLRPHYATDFYAAYCRDPEGHKLCFVHTEG